MVPEPARSETDDSTSFVDREDILKELNHYKEMVSSGEGRCVFLKGETGVGKTRISDEFLRRCEEGDFKILRGRCLYYEGTEPYLPFYEGLEDYLEEEEESEEETTSPAFMGQPTSSGSSESTPMSFIATEEDEEEVTDEMSFSDQQDMMFNRVTDILKDISEKKPVIFFMDDLQWIDDSSAQLLHHLARNISDNRIFLLGAFRPEELRYERENPPLENTLNRMKEEKVLSIIEINRLDQQSVSELVKDYLERKDLPEEFIWTLYRESEGNPFYVIEILNSMMQEGVLDPKSYTWNPEEELSNISIPSSIKDITSRKIEKLDKDQKKVLMFASLLGTEFNFQILEKVVDMDVIELLDIIDSLEEQGLIQEVPDSDDELYRFHHLQTRTVLYEEMGRSRKRVTHQRIGEILEDFYEGELSEHQFELSRHFFEGKQYEKAFRYSKKAAEKSLQGLDISTAIDYFEKALESLQKGENIEEAEEKERSLLERLGDLYYDISDWRSAKEIYIDMIRRARERNDEEMEALGLRRLGHVYKELREHDKAEGYCEQALEISKKLDDPKGIAESNRALGYVHWREGEHEEGKEHYEEAIEKAKKSDSDKELALNYLALANIYAQQGEHDRAIEYYEKSLPPLEANNVYRQLARAHNNIGDQYMKKKEWDKAIEYFDKCLDYAGKINNKQFLGWGAFNAAEIYTRIGETEKASEYLEGTEDILKQIDDYLGLAAVHHVRGMIKEEEGDLDSAVEYYERALDIMEDLEVPFNRAEYTLDLGIAYKEKGKYGKAEENLKKAKETFERIGAADKFIDKAKEALESISSSSDEGSKEGEDN
ncbi:MAG: tetratricopeptide repeat protein [Candidatus Thermoplasmatota archaeon]|nr:tetratricopeptide repeat protein [Candidatus Thermoplasmatota archaeon]